MARQDTSSNRLKYEDPEYPVSVVFTDLANTELADSTWQWHEDIKIIIINSGSAQIGSDDQNIRLLPGQAVLIGRNVMHSILQYGSDPCSYYSVTFHPDFVLGDNNSRLKMDYFRQMEEHGIRFMIFDENVPWHNELLDHINSIIVANTLNRAGYELATRGYLCLTCALLAAHLDDDAGELDDVTASADERRVKDAMSYIRDNYAEKISLEEISDHVHISKSECCRCFKRCIGMTPFEYLMKYRIFQAADMLRNPKQPDQSIAEIAFSTGFNNLSYFSKLFGKYMNCTPRQYRTDARSHNPSTDLMSLR